MALAKISALCKDVDGTSPRFSSCREILQIIRDSRLYHPRVVVLCGKTALSRLSKDSKEYWDVAVQMCTAAAQLGDFDKADALLTSIKDKFALCSRTSILCGIMEEAKGCLKPAMDIYIKTINEHPMATMAYKRQVAVLKSELKYPEAISMINYYLSMFPTDVDAWAELCSLTLLLGRYSHALFAANELIVNDPGNYAYHILTADIYMTVGGHENLLQARKFYSSSLIERKHGNLRALYGLWLANFKLSMENTQNHASKDDLANNIQAFTASAVDKVYESVQKTSGPTPSRSVASRALRFAESPSHLKQT